MRLLGSVSLWRVLLACAALGLIGCMAIELLARPGNDAQLAAARTRWAARALPTYRLVVEEETTAGRCQQDVRIQDEQIRQIFRNSCVRLPTWTISNLFTWAAQLADGRSRCYPTNITCVCYTVYSAQADYDPGFGYPRRVTYQWELRTNWSYPNHWQRLWQYGELPSCLRVSRFAEGHITITVVALTPLP